MRDLEPSLDWINTGTALFLHTLEQLSDSALFAPTALPGWTGRHLIAHVAGNADALINLVDWATTGVETPMYESPEQRNADIETGAVQEPQLLRRRARESAERLAAALQAVPPDSWGHEIRTAQGRVVPATEIAWLRAREVMIHSVDLGADTRFDDLPTSFLLALVTEIADRRSAGANPALLLEDTEGRRWTVHGHGPPTELRDTLSTIAAVLTGRPVSATCATVARDLRLPPWL